MYVPGEAVDGIPVEYPLTHEYGHHIASWRSNEPWDALDWGPKYWVERDRSVCDKVRNRLLFPGNQGAHYLDDPGEGFADGYAHLQYPDAPWYYNELDAPGSAAFAAIRRDVLGPWSGPRSRTFRGRLGTATRPPQLPYPDAAGRGPGAAAGGAARDRVRGPGGDARLRRWAQAARPRQLRHRVVPAAAVDRIELTVRRRSGAGPFALRVSWPG